MLYPSDWTIANPVCETPWNRINCLEGLSDEDAKFMASAIRKDLGADPENTAVGLLPAINELLRSRNCQPIQYGYPALPMSERAQTATCEILSHIANGPPSLVMTSTTPTRHSNPAKLIKRICNAFPTASIVVFMESNSARISLTKALREEGHSCWNFEKEYQLQEDEPYPVHRIRITRLRHLALNNLKLWEADIVIMAEAVDFVQFNYFGHYSQLFDTWSGTHIKAGARLVGIAPENTHLSDLKAVWSVFGLRPYLLGQNGYAVLAPRVYWARRTTTDNTHLRVGNNISELQLKKVMIWLNDARNNFIVKQIKTANKLITNIPVFNSRCGGDINSIAIVVENTIHFASLNKKLEDHGVRCHILTFDQIRNETVLPSILIRADAGIGLLPIGAQEHPIAIIDIQDESPRFLRERYKMRKNAYSKVWAEGEMPFCNKYRGK